MSFERQKAKTFRGLRPLILHQGSVMDPTGGAVIPDPRPPAAVRATRGSCS